MEGCSRVEILHSRVEIPPSRVEMPHSRLEMPLCEVEMPHIYVDMPQSYVEMTHRQVDMPNSRVEMTHCRMERPQRQVDTSHISVDMSHRKEEIPLRRVEVPNRRIEVPNMITEVPNNRVDMPQSNQLSRDDLESSCGDQQQHMLIPVTCKHWLFNWTVAGGLFGVIVLMGWLCIVGLLVLKEQWQLVIMAWMVIYCIVHFSYWYCKRHGLYFFNRNVRIRIIAHLGDTSLLSSILTEKEDDPPSYDDVIDTELPPPSYGTAVAQYQGVSDLGSMSRVEVNQAKHDETNYEHQINHAHYESTLPD